MLILRFVYDISAEIY